MPTKNLIVDAGTLFRLASATTATGGNLLDTLLRPNTQLIVPDAVRLEATYNTRFANTPIIEDWLNRNSSRISVPTTQEGAAAQQYLAINGTVARQQFGDQAIISVAKQLSGVAPFQSLAKTVGLQTAFRAFRVLILLQLVVWYLKASFEVP